MEVKRKKIKTGQLSPSKIEGCPVFTPNKLNDNLIKSLSLVGSECLSEDFHNHQLGKTFEPYFCKFFAGNNSLVEDIADIPIETLYLWYDAKIAKTSQVKFIVKNAIRFNNLLQEIRNSDALTINKLIKWNKLALPKKAQYGIRRNKMLVGNPKKVSYAFYAPDKEVLIELCEDAINFVNSNKTSALNTALISMMQFFFIHPFYDANGRMFRALSIVLLQKEFGLINAFLLNLYLKNINREGYYFSQKFYRAGNLESIVNYHKRAIKWANKSALILKTLLDDYLNLTKQKNLNDKNYSQIIVKIKNNTTQELDTNIFKLHGTKGINAIYINTALLNVINQFDYYLRFELRACMLQNNM